MWTTYSSCITAYNRRVRIQHTSRRVGDTLSSAACLLQRMGQEPRGLLVSQGLYDSKTRKYKVRDHLLSVAGASILGNGVASICIATGFARASIEWGVIGTVVGMLIMASPLVLDYVWN